MAEWSRSSTVTLLTTLAPFALCEACCSSSLQSSARGWPVTRVRPNCGPSSSHLFYQADDKSSSLNKRYKCSVAVSASMGDWAAACDPVLVGSKYALTMSLSFDTRLSRGTRQQMPPNQQTTTFRSRRPRAHMGARLEDNRRPRSQPVRAERWRIGGGQTVLGGKTSNYLHSQPLINIPHWSSHKRA